MVTTYVTLSTPVGEGGINIIELIGLRAPQLILKIFKPKRSSPFVTLSPSFVILNEVKNLRTGSAKSLRDSSSPDEYRGTQNDISGRIGRLEPHRLYLGHIYDQAKPIDEVIINLIPSKESFSGLDTIEINSHGGIMPAKKIMSLLGRRGAKKITTSQLYRLALKHQRLNTIQIEALEALQSAPTSLAAQVLLDQYNGVLSREVKQILTYIDKTFTPLEVSRQRRLSPDVTSGGPLTGQDALLSKLTKILTSARLGLALTIPKRIVIGGLPNVGKSTLFNALVGREKVIVHHLPGTTRDVVEELISIDGIPLSLRDTAGLNDLKAIKISHQIVEKEGIKKAKRQISTADLIILLIDSSQPLSRDISKVIKLLRGRLVIYVLNKNDLPRRLKDTKISEFTLRLAEGGLSDLSRMRMHTEKLLRDPEATLLGLVHSGVVNSAISISALHQRGLTKLRQTILDSLQLTPALYKPGQAVVFTPRQYGLLKEAYQNIRRAQTKKSLSSARNKIARLI